MTSIMDIIIKGMEDTAEECQIQSLQILGRLLTIAPGVVMSSIEGIVNGFEKLFDINSKNHVKASEKAQNIMRACLRVVEALQRTADIEASAQFTEFFRTKIQENAEIKEMYEKIATTASKAITGDAF